MAIILRNKKNTRYFSAQFRHAITYLLSTTIALLILNIFCSTASQRLFYQSKEDSMIEKAQFAAVKIGSVDALNHASVSEALNQLSPLKVTQIIVTDQSGQIILDSNSGAVHNQYALIPEIVEALSEKDVFTWSYHSGAMQSEVAIPIMSYGITVGCVYMMEYDTAQGSLVHTLQMTVLTISVLLEVALLLFALFSSHIFSSRLNEITDSMRFIQDGNYSERVNLKGRDELAYLASEFNNLARLLQISENKRRQFVSDASHELKTPLASIKLLSDSILQNEMDLETAREFVSDIGEEAERLNRMTQKLLDLTRGEDEAIEDDREIIYMAPTINKVVHMLSALAASTGITIITKLERDTTILIREGDLYRIVYNLLENGIKYNSADGSVTITLDKNEEFGILTVSDTGMGIPQEAIGKIFERFYRVDKARSRATGGSGLGLSIVRSMMERNHGNIRVESEVGSGTVFTLEFPAFDMEVSE